MRSRQSLQWASPSEAILRSVLVPLPPLEWAGLQVFAANLNPALRAAGWRWITVVPEEAKIVQNRLREAGVDVVPAALPRFRRSPVETLKTLWALPSNARQLAAMPEARGADIVQAVGAHHPHGMLLASRLRKPFVWQLHSSVIPYIGRRIIAPIISAKADAIMTNGRRVARAFWGRDDLGPNHFVFYAPVNAERFRPNPAARAAARSELGYSDEDVVVGTVGNRVWQKNHELLINVAGQLAGRHRRLRFCILGAPSESYQRTYQESVEAPAAELNAQYPNYIRFVEPDQRVDHWIHALDVFTMTSHAEGVPIALFEAMCAAKPVVSVSVGSIDEIVVHGETGLLCPKGDTDALAQAYASLAENLNMRQRFGAASAGRIEQHFSLSAVAQAHVAAYETAITRFQRR
jgi:glycosyltransferase involved in cell wall biosynthesis